MKQIITLLAAALVTLASCDNSGNIASDRTAMYDRIDAISADSTLSVSEKERAFVKVFEEVYVSHRKDSLGLYIFGTLCSYMWDAQTAVDNYARASKLVRGDERIARCIANRKAELDLSAGKRIIDYEGVDVLTQNPLKLSDAVASFGKPVIIDFWASWCPGCREEIKNSLVDLYASGQVGVVGIAVWEDSIEDTRRAMEELGVSWPVIFAGGRENDLTARYGINAIPTMLKVTPDGTIVSRGFNCEELL